MKKTLESVINRVTDHKAEADLIFNSSKSLKMSAQNGKISTYQVTSAQMLGIRIIKDQRVGIAFTESLDDESLRFMVTQAMQNAELGEPIPDESILNLSGELADLGDYPEEETDIAQKTELALALEGRIKSMEPRTVATPYNSYSEGESSALYLSSKGRFTRYSDKSYNVMTSALLDEAGKKAMFYDYSLSHTFKGLSLDQTVENTLFHARNLLQEKTVPSGRYAIRFNPDCLKNLLECFSNLYSAKSTMDKLNPWGEKLGQDLISPNLTIKDDARFSRAFRINKFDSEGVETKSITLVKDGRLQSFLHNSRTANHFKTETTGHAFRSAAGPLGVSGTHFIVESKETKPTPQKYLEIIQMDGLYSGANLVTGNFSFGAKGYLWENGERVQTFGGVTVSGNIMEILKSAEAISLELEASRDRSFFSVPLIFNGLSVAGS